ncbi:hypothetical protein NDU88_006606 [Pleurodeles waltl]|uniref:Uncharacterized protein n=1 Tax=Pleurodeles waltl TaxID=8319 RepID=A0AAV7QIH5_PLEWA|nr:hypothetical protein NDU88_006606 [Pleurodeles waltl]
MQADASNRLKPDPRAPKKRWKLGAQSSGGRRLAAEAATEISGPTVPELSKSRKAQGEGAGERLHSVSANNFRGYQTSKQDQPYVAPVANSPYDVSVDPALK